MAVRLGIVIIHYNTPEDLGRCLESLRAQAPACSHEVLVVDNASSCPGLDELQERYPEVQWIRNTENLGYGRGCNQGMAALAADYHLILNPDIVVLPGSLDALIAFADDHPRAGLIGPQLLNEDGTIQESCRRFYTFWTLLLRRTPLGKLRPNSRTIQRHLMRDFDHGSVRPVDWVLGGCLLVRREALARCGPMDDRFFLYFEDVDWCYRMWQCGFEVVYLPDARFVHRHRRSSAKGALSKSFWLHLGSLISFYEKWSLVVYAAKKWRRPLEVGLHWLLDMVLLAVALLGAYAGRRLAQPFFDEDLLPLSWYGSWLGYAAILVTVAFVVMGRYRAARLHEGVSPGDHLRQMGLVALMLLAGSYLGRDSVVSRVVLMLTLGFYTGLTAWASQLVGRVHRRLERGYFILERTLLAGPRTELDRWLSASGDLRDLGTDVVGYVTDDPVAAGGHHPLGGGEVPWLGTSEQLPVLVERFRVSQVAFWQASRRENLSPAILVPLRRARIRLRWILDEAWLLAVGARAEPFGTLASGVLDPDDGQTLRRLAARPPEILVAGMLLLISGCLALPRWWGLRAGSIRRERVDGSPSRTDNGWIAMYTDGQGQGLPLWWQSGLALALLRGEVALSGRPLAGSDQPVDPVRLLRDTGADRPGLTGPWAGRGRLTTFLLNPGGWAAVAGSGEGETPRSGGEEVNES